MKKFLKNKYFYIALALVLVAAGIALLPSGREESGVQVVEEVLAAQAETGELTGELVYSGTIADTGSSTLSLAGSITVEQWQVKAGDYVQAGEVLATIDKNSALAAIAQLYELTQQLDSAIEDSRSDVLPTTVTAPVSGRVKAIFAQSGQSVASVMGESGALLLLSLDGKMAVDLPAGSLTLGQQLMVTLSDGTALTGTVAHLADGVATVTLSDETAPYDDAVTLTDGDGQTVGIGNLYIHSQVKVTGYAGVVETLYVSLNTQVAQGQSLLSLSDTGDTSGYQRLLSQLRRLEEQMQDLFAAWQSGELCAPASGCVTQLIAAEESAKRLAFTLDSGSVVLLSNEEPEPEPEPTPEPESSPGTEPEPGSDPDPSPEPTPEPEPPEEEETVKYLAQVTAVTEGEDGSRELQLSLSDGSSLTLTSGELEGLTGTVPVSDIKAGDILILCYSKANQLLSVTVYKSSENEQGGINMPSQVPSGMGGGGGSMGGASGGDSQEQEPDYTMAETRLCSFSPYETASIDLSVDELDISSFSLGQTVTVSLEALGGQQFSAQVTAIDPEGSNSGGNSKYTVTVTLPRTENMLTGMTANVSLALETRQNVLCIPLAALQEDASGIYVYTGYNRRTGELSDPVPVTTGASDGERVEILSGLAGGDSLYYRYASGLEYRFQR